MVERFPELAQFFGCYFHQDWDIEAADDEGLVRLYLSQEPESSITAARRELDEFLAEDLSEDELATTLLHSFGCYYSPTFFGFTTRRWLERIRDLLAEGRPPA
jgi:CdiI immunity protein